MQVFSVKDRFSRSQAWLAHAFNLSALEAEVGRSLCSQEGEVGEGFSTVALKKFN